MSKLQTKGEGQFYVNLRQDPSSSCIRVAVCPQLDFAINVALNLHQISSCKHYVTVEDGDGVKLLTLLRVDTEVLQVPKPQK